MNPAQQSLALTPDQIGSFQSIPGFGLYAVLLFVFVVATIVLLWRASKFSKVYRQLLNKYQHNEFTIDHLTDAIVECDSNLVITRVNKAGELLFGLKESDILGFKVVEEAKDEPNLAALIEIFYPGKGGPAAHTLPRHDGHTDDTQEIIIKKSYEQKLRIFTIPKIDERTKTQIGFIKIVRDITQDEIISRNKSDLITIVSHQLRTPLSGIKWILGALVDGDFGPMTPEQLDVVKRGIEANDGIISMVDDMLDVSKIERSEFVYTFENTEIVKFVKEIVTGFAEQAATKHIQLVEMYGEPSITAPIDVKRLRIGFANLIDNAINYSPENSSITISLTQDGKYFYYSVKDNGIGIPEKSRPQLFTKFFRAENAQRIRASGTGLGLFLVKSIAAGHGGSITFESTEGKGTTFIVAIPLNQVRA